MKMKIAILMTLFAALSTGLSQLTAKVFEVKNSWNTGFQGEINVPVNEETTYGWKLQIKFHRQIQSFEVWIGKLQSTEQGESGTQYTYVNFAHNKVLEAGSTMKVEFNGGFIANTEPAVPPVTVKFQGRIIYSDYFTINNAAATLSTTDIAFILNSLTRGPTTTSVYPRRATTSSTPAINNIRTPNTGNVGGNQPETGSNDKNSIVDINAINNRNNEMRNNANNGGGNDENTDAAGGEADYDAGDFDVEPGSGDAPETFNRRPARRTKYPYIRAIHKSLLFYEAQRSGRLPPDNRISWRGDSAMNDRGDYGEDLTGGYYDAGDHMKFGFPMAFSITTLAWGVIEYWEAYQQAGELENALKALKWGTDYILKSYVSKNEFYGQVGLGDRDHKYWGRPEDMRMARPAFKITAKKPGSDLAAESSAALSASSIAFMRSGMLPYAHPTHLALLRKTAGELYQFAKSYPGKYHESIPDAAAYYKSSDYLDEVTWGLTWLYRATGNETYLREAEGKYQNLGQFKLPIKMQFSWDDKTVGIQLLLAQVTHGVKKQNYLERVEAYCKEIRTRRDLYTPKRLLFMDEWSPLRYAANIAFICLMAADEGIETTNNLGFATHQIHYMLGDSGRSYLIGFGRRYPTQPHHRGSSCAVGARECTWSDFHSPKPNPIILEGALVGGPNKKDMFKDSRKNFMSLEVTLDHNSCFQGALAGLLKRSIIGITMTNNRTWETWYVETATTTPATRRTTTSASVSSFVQSSACIIYLTIFTQLLNTFAST